jgi:hypothetical protein
MQTGMGCRVMVNPIQLLQRLQRQFLIQKCLIDLALSVEQLGQFRVACGNLLFDRPVQIY